MTHISILPTRGAAALDYIPELAKLRIEVFREFPYLYDGDMAYEENYLRTYVQSPRSVIVVALDGGAVIGASTALPMADETEEFQGPFLNGAHDPAKVFYFGESILRKAYRGQGIGVRFFQARALENQCYMVQAPTVGNAPWCDTINTSYGCASVFTPPDVGFPADGIIATGQINTEQWLIAELDLDKVARVRSEGQVQNYLDWNRQKDFE